MAAGARKGITDVQSVRRLEYWRTVIEKDRAAWEPERAKMDWREELFGGTHKMKPTCRAEEKLKEQLRCWHVRNVIAENIESMVDSRVPRPKVTALNKNDEGLARTLEQLLRFYVERHHLRTLNDMAERMGPIQGGFFWMEEWDDGIITPDGPGDVKVSIIHPKQVIPQAGVYTDVEDMDHITVLVPMTVLQVWQRYGVDVEDLSEEDPQARGRDGETESEDTLVTVYQLYYRNGRGGIGNLAWCGDVILSDREDYQARRLLRCRDCGAVASYARGTDPEREEELKIAGQMDDRPRRCLWCEGTSFEEIEVDSRAIMPGEKSVFMTNGGEEIELEPAVAWKDGQGRVRYEERGTVPYYRPDKFPIHVQKNISRFGQLLGESDVDKQEDAQNLVKRLDQKIIDRIVKAGTIISLPSEVRLETSTEDQRVYRVDDPSKMSLIKTFEFTGDISNEVEIEARAYEQARQATGVTDSMQGRRDATATSAKAKEFSAAKAEGRMESRRVMKQIAWGRMYEMIAKLYLAYADESRRVRVEQPTGEVTYSEFRQSDFLKIDDKGEVYYEDGFLFSCDDATSIGESREAMWQEINASFSAGTLGNPQQLSTLILYWGLMEEQGYPGAANIKRKLEEQQEQAIQAARAQQTPVPTGTDPSTGTDGGPMLASAPAGGMPGGAMGGMM